LHFRYQILARQNATTTPSKSPCPQPAEPFYGQDAQYQGPARSYTKLDATGNALPDSAASWAMVRDNVTGLIWEVKTNKDNVKNYNNPHDADNTYTWYDSNPATNGGNAGTSGSGTDTEDFIAELNAANFGGHNDWRLPTIKELSTLVNSSIVIPSIDAAWFPNTVSSSYCSSTTYAGYTGYAWSVDFGIGGVYGHYKSYSYYVRAVRGGQTGPLDDLIINDDGTVSDPNTNLMWQQATAAGTYNWEQALSYVHGLNTQNFAGYSDWRLPNRNELQTLVDYSRYNPTIDPLLAPTTVSSVYWSSTTVANFYAWYVDFLNGYVDYSDKSNSYYVRAVRGGQSV
jgi:hypothetical protein